MGHKPLNIFASPEPTLHHRFSGSSIVCGYGGMLQPRHAKPASTILIC
jgi:hypothetical protein